MDQKSASRFHTTTYADSTAFGLRVVCPVIGQSERLASPMGRPETERCPDTERLLLAGISQLSVQSGPGNSERLRCPCAMVAVMRKHALDVAPLGRGE